ncbi:MAG: 4'-phosphopantetheinyl transferase superfamily protein [Hyphomonadaceae bacterium]|nr:4'-phosphopantetheinyl transferase superfamily protein [Hyphomonadaceae bacterium]
MIVRVAVSDRDLEQAGTVAHIGPWRVTTLGDAAADDADLSPEEARRVQATQAPHAAESRRAAYALRRRLLAAWAGADCAAIVAPAFRAPDGHGAHVSLSHTQGGVAVACAAGPVGVDIERIVPHPTAVRVARRVFAGEDHVAIADAAPDEAAWAFTWRWCAKEALLKATGLSFTAAMATAMGPHADAPFVRGVRGVSIAVFRPAPGFACAVARA